MVMSRIGAYQSGTPGPSGSFLIGAQAGPVSAQASGGVSTGDAQWTGIVILIALAIVLIGQHGLKGG